MHVHCMYGNIPLVISLLNDTVHTLHTNMVLANLIINQYV